MSEAPWEKIEAQIAAVNDYNTSAEAARDAALAAFEYVAHRCGLTGFQASWAALAFYGKAMSIDGPYTVFNAEDLLYPQYDLPDRLRQWIESDEMKTWLADQADEKLAESGSFAVTSVIAHWRKLSQDRPPVNEQEEE